MFVWIRRIIILWILVFGGILIYNFFLRWVNDNTNIEEPIENPEYNLDDTISENIDENVDENIEETTENTLQWSHFNLIMKEIYSWRENWRIDESNEDGIIVIDINDFVKEDWDSEQKNEDLQELKDFLESIMGDLDNQKEPVQREDSIQEETYVPVQNISVNSNWLTAAEERNTQILFGELRG